MERGNTKPRRWAGALISTLAARPSRSSARDGVNAAFYCAVIG